MERSLGMRPKDALDNEKNKRDKCWNSRMLALICNFYVKMLNNEYKLYFKISIKKYIQFETQIKVV